MPVHNAGPSLKRSAQSVTSQSYTNLELILVDDGSTDGSSTVCDQLASADPRIVVIHQANAGVSAARNAGMAQATGEYLAFVDADDALNPGALSIVVPRLEQEQADFACFGMTFLYGVGSKMLDRRVLSVDSELLLDEPEALREQFFELFDRNYWSSVCNKVFRTDFVRKHDLAFDSLLAVLEDLDFVVRALTHLPKVIALPEPLYDYRNDLTAFSFSRRPQIDYFRSFGRLEESLNTMAIALDMRSASEIGRLRAMTFRFYLIGMELLFARRMAHPQRFRSLRGYASEARVFDAARKAAPSRRGVDAAAACVRHRSLLALYLLLFANHWAAPRHRMSRVTVAWGRPSLRR